MKKIFNWTFGSVFRTFGRVIAYIIIGTIISFILSRSNFRITDLFLDNVKASTITYSGGIGYQGLTSVGNGYQYFTMNESSNMQMKDIPISLANNKNGNELRIPFLVSGDLKNAYRFTHSNGVYQCSAWTSSGSGYYCSEWLPYNEYDNIPTEYELNLNVMLGYYDGGNGGIACTIDVGGNTIICPLFNSTNISYNHLYIYYSYKATATNQTIKFNLAGSVTILQSDEYIIEQGINSNTNAINNQTQTIINSTNQTQQTIIDSTNQTQQTIIDSTNQTISTITDNTSPDLNGTLDNNTIAGWLPAGPIDSIVTLPLTLLNSLFNAMGGTCADLVVPLPFVNKNLNIPCMSRVYNDMSFGSFFNWIGVVASAFILYKYLLRLYKWIDATLTLRENTQVDWGGD